MVAAILHQPYGFPSVARPLKLNKHQMHAAAPDLEIELSTGPAALSPSMHPCAAGGARGTRFSQAKLPVLPKTALFLGHVEVNHECADVIPQQCFFRKNRLGPVTGIPSIII